MNILPFYGYLSEGHRLLNTLHPKTRKAWKEYRFELVQNLFQNYRSTLQFIYIPRRGDFDWAEILLKMLEEHKILLEIFIMPGFHFTNEEQISRLHSLCESVGMEYTKFTSLTFNNSDLAYKFRKTFTQIPSTVEPIIFPNCSLLFQELGFKVDGYNKNIDLNNEKEIVKYKFDYYDDISEVDEYTELQFNANSSAEFLEFKQEILDLLGKTKNLKKVTARCNLPGDDDLSEILSIFGQKFQGDFVYF